jgi:hypothetical protein
MRCFDEWTQLPSQMNTFVERYFVLNGTHTVAPLRIFVKLCDNELFRILLWHGVRCNTTPSQAKCLSPSFDCRGTAQYEYLKIWPMDQQNEPHLDTMVGK